MGAAFGKELCWGAGQPQQAPRQKQGTRALSHFMRRQRASSHEMVRKRVQLAGACCWDQGIPSFMFPLLQAPTGGGAERILQHENVGFGVNRNQESFIQVSVVYGIFIFMHLDLSIKEAAFQPQLFQERVCLH